MDFHKMIMTGEGAEHLDEHILDLDSEFRFKCRRCGKCCIHQHTIILTTRDLYNIAKKQNRPIKNVIEDYTEIYIGRNSRLPVVHLLSNGKNDSCPLLVDGLCSVHDCKPAVCALYPLGRVIKQHYDEKSGIRKEPTVHYILNDVTCGSAKRVNTVRSWLERSGIAEHDEFYLLWNELMMDLCYIIRDMEKTDTAERSLVAVWSIITTYLYFNYNIEEDLMPQFERNTRRLMRFCRLLKKYLTHTLRAEDVKEMESLLPPVCA